MSVNAAPTIIQLHGLTKHFGNVMALRDVSLDIPLGITGLLGPNGAGKSTLIKILLGLVRPTSGSGMVEGRDVLREGKAIRASVGFMPEDDCYIPGISGVEMVHFAACLNGYASQEALRRAHEVLDFCGTEEERYREVDTYSTGMRQKLKFAQALVHDPSLLILDEPTSGLDPDERQIMLGRIRVLSRKAGMSVLISTHILPDVQQICDHAIVLVDGEVRRVDSIENLNRPASPSLHLRIVGDEQRYCQVLREAGIGVTTDSSGRLVVSDPDGDLAGQLWSLAHHSGVGIRSLAPARTSLDDVFIQAMQQGEAGDGNA
ncbi:MAG: ABC transporter ATP-binding protein [Planctomycetota bacterium]|nr:ABC transporter ATP-binding protein [Planctomycetota bacterium]